MVSNLTELLVVKEMKDRKCRGLFWRLTHVGGVCVCVCLGRGDEGRKLNMHEKAHAFQQH